jgi:hypothetical protein
MISSRSPSLLKPFQRWNPLSIARRVPPVVGVRNFISPAVKRYRQKQLLGGNNKATTTIVHKDLPHSFEEMDNNTLLTVAALHNHDARIEVLKRHIMSVDRCSHAEATEMFQKIAKKNREGMALAALPYQLGITAGAAAAIVAVPMVFDLNTTLWFNEYFVTTDVPGKEDLETPLEVGAWAWNWMEPPLGTLSFLLLSLQFSRYVDSWYCQSMQQYNGVLDHYYYCCYYYYYLFGRRSHCLYLASLRSTHTHPHTNN